MRIYGQWAGNKKGIPEDTTRCVAGVHSNYRTYQCRKLRGHGPDGLWCKQHGRMEEGRLQRLAEREARRK